MPAEAPDMKFYFIVTTLQRTAAPVHAEMVIYAAAVEMRFSHKGVGTFDRTVMKAWLCRPGKPLTADATEISYGTDKILRISIADEVYRSPLPTRTSQQLIRII